MSLIGNKFRLNETASWTATSFRGQMAQSSTQKRALILAFLFIIITASLKALSPVTYIETAVVHEITKDDTFPAAAIAEILSQRNFFYMMFVNEAYIPLVKSWICNLRVVDPALLTAVVLFTDHEETARSLAAFQEGIKVFNWHTKVQDN